jgi:hypothetical protein
LPRHQVVESAAGYAEAVQSDGSNRWVRHQLAPGVELHVREDALPSQRPLIDRLLAAAQSASGDEAESRSGLERNE